MNKSVEKFISKLKQDKKLLFIIILGISGMLLLLLSGSTDKKSETVSSDKEELYEISDRMEKELEDLLRTVQGAGKVKVMVTVDSLEEKTVAVNTEHESSSESTDFKDEYVIIENSSGSDGLVLKITAPVIRGVGISCQGATSAQVKQEITRLVSAALGIPVNKIWVTQMQE